LAAILSAQRCRERDLVVGMIAQRLLDPCSKLATTRAWRTCWPRSEGASGGSCWKPPRRG
jgi:hypothetical protein